ncbi:MAG: hypothetical protein LBQ75_07940 [Zoogloeaceae bacterium]|jgi:hypothetical protein|nr:hypothetical protein [Zoogloeaceae bacterium]
MSSTIEKSSRTPWNATVLRLTARLSLPARFGEAMKDRLYYPRRGEGGFIITSMIVLVVLACLVALFWLNEKQKKLNDHYDAEVDRLCAVDGGVKVYETVRLPPEKFGSWRGNGINFFDPTQGENALGSEFIYKWKITVYQERNPFVDRNHYEVIRRADNKLLGEATSYGRSGGDVLAFLGLPAAGEPHRCPPPSELAGDGSLFNQIFVKSE